MHRTGPGDPAWRNYTIGRTGDSPRRVTLQHHAGGVVSPRLSGRAEGAEVLVSGPYCDAAVDVRADDPLLVTTAGIGMMPALTVAGALAAAGSDRPIEFVRAAPDVDLVPHRGELEGAVGKLATSHLHLRATVRRGAARTPARPTASGLLRRYRRGSCAHVGAAVPISFVRGMVTVLDARRASGLHPLGPVYSP